MSEHLLNNGIRRESRHSNWSREHKLDAVILAGTHKNHKRLINGTNKAFLELKGKPLVYFVVKASLDSSRINRTVVVGPRNTLKQVLSDLVDEYPHRLRIIQQRSRLLENVWNGFLATFDDGNNLPVNIRIENLLLGGHIPIRKRAHLHLIKAVYAAVAGQMLKHDRQSLHRGAVVAIMERRFDEFRERFERQEWFMGKMGVETLLVEGHVLQEFSSGVVFREDYLKEYFEEWERRFQKFVFVTGSDLPLITPKSIDDYINRCNQVSGDFFVGASSHEVLKHFYSTRDGNPGFIRPYLSFREAEIRAANLIIVRPNRVGNKELIQESFGVRKMTKWRNVFAVVWKLLRLSGRFQTVKMTTMLQTTAILKKYGFRRLAAGVQQFTRVKDFELLLSRIFMTKLKLLESPYGGVSLDVDEETDFELFAKDFDYWSEMQDKVVSKTRNIPFTEYHRVGCFKDIESDLPG